MFKSLLENNSSTRIEEQKQCKLSFKLQSINDQLSERNQKIRQRLLALPQQQADFNLGQLVQRQSKRISTVSSSSYTSRNITPEFGRQQKKVFTSDRKSKAKKKIRLKRQYRVYKNLNSVHQLCKQSN